MGCSVHSVIGIGCSEHSVTGIGCSMHRFSVADIVTVLLHFVCVYYCYVVYALYMVLNKCPHWHVALCLLSLMLVIIVYCLL